MRKGAKRWIPWPCSIGCLFKWVSYTRYMEILPVLAVAVAAVFGAMGQLEFKRGLEGTQLNLQSLLTNWHLLAGFALYGTATIVYLLALRRGELSVLYPIIATSYIWTALLAVYFLGEKMTFINWFGILFIVLGVGLVIR